MANRWRILSPGVLAAPLLLAAASTALAQDVTTYGLQADYDAAVGHDDVCLDFNGSTGALVSGATFSGAVTFGSPEATDPTLVNWSSDAISDAGSATALNGIGTVDGTFTGTAKAFKFTFLSNAVQANVEIFAEDGTSIAGFLAPNSPGFFGIVSSVPVKRFLITPGVFDPTLGNRDRFFIDDFCATAEIGTTPPPAPDLAAMCHDFAAAVAAADPAAFRGRNRQHALANKLRVVCDRIEAGGVEDLCAAKRRLERDVLRKMDGDRAPSDWVTDAAVQQSLEDQANALIAALDDAIAALGGCPSHPDDGDDDGGDGGSGPPADPGSNGRGHGKGNGRH